jgi:hypothetical protein
MNTKVDAYRILLTGWPRALLAFVLVALFLFGILFLLWVLPKHQVPSSIKDPETRFTVEDRARQTLASVFGAGFLLVTGVATWTTVRATQKNVKVAEENLRVTQENFRVTQDKQATDNFIKALEMLGASSFVVRAGGIYTLERILKYSSDQKQSIIDILATYIRQNSLLLSEDEKAKDVVFLGLRIDIQSALTVLSRRTQSNVNIEAIKVLLHNSNLRGAQLTAADFRSIYLHGVDLSNSVISGANFEGVILKKANLTGASLQNAIMREVDFEDTILLGTNLGGADLRNARKLTQSQLDSAVTNAETQASPPLQVKLPKVD